MVLRQHRFAATRPRPASSCSPIDDITVRTVCARGERSGSAGLQPCEFGDFVQSHFEGRFSRSSSIASFAGRWLGLLCDHRIERSLSDLAG